MGPSLVCLFVWKVPLLALAAPLVCVRTPYIISHAFIYCDIFLSLKFVVVFSHCICACGICVCVFTMLDAHVCDGQKLTYVLSWMLPTFYTKEGFLNWPQSSLVGPVWLAACFGDPLPLPLKIWELRLATTFTWNLCGFCGSELWYSPANALATCAANAPQPFISYNRCLLRHLF